MKKVYPVMVMLVCLFVSTASAQQQTSSSESVGRTVILDLNIIEVNAARAEDFENLTKDKARLDRLIAEGKAQPVAGVQMRARSGEQTSARVGQRVPIQTATLPAMGQPREGAQRDRQGSAQFIGVGIPQIQYENTGLNADAMPRVVGDNQIEVRLRLEMTGLDRSTGALTPSFIQRTLNNTVRVREGETAVLLGIIQHESLWPPAQNAANPKDQSRGSFVVLLTARFQD